MLAVSDGCAMKKVVLFKSESEEYQRAFSDLNYETIFVEPLQFVFLSLPQLSERLDAADYDGIILTSPRAIEAVAKCWHPTKYVLWTTKKVYTVGEVSAKNIQHLLGLESLGTSSGNANNLAKIIVSENPKGSKFLFPCGNLRSETIVEVLQAEEMMVDALNVYETKESESLKTDLMQLNDSPLSPCCMVFFSPSGCEYIHRQLQTFSNSLSFLPHFAIGNSTAHKIVNLGVDIAGVAVRPKPECMVESVQKYFLELETPS